MTWQLILASSSPRRKELLSHTKVPFTIKVIPTEEVSSETEPALFALDVARQKGEALLNSVARDKTLVVSADTVVALDKRILGKPRDTKEARDFLQLLSGGSHHVHTGLCLQVYMNGTWSLLELVETSKVRFNVIPERLLEDYLASGDALDKAGAYGIQGQALTFISSVEGCYSNVVGFPLAKFCQMMQEDFLRMTGEQGPWQNLFCS
jgi:septum formation protein